MCGATDPQASPLRPIFDLEVGLEGSWLSPAQFAAAWPKHPGVLLQSDGGAGKTSFLLRACDTAMADGPVFFLDLANHEDARLPNTGQFPTFFDATSLGGDHSLLIACLAAGRPTFLCVDGVDRHLTPDEGRLLFDHLAVLSNRHGSLRILVADRRVERQDGVWTPAEIRLAQGQAAALIRVHLGKELDKQEEALLSLPFFLDLAIRTKALNRPAMFAAFYGIDQGPAPQVPPVVKLTATEIDKLCSWALANYDRRNLDATNPLTKEPLPCEERLRTAGVVDTANQFRHQLYQEYLVGRAVCMLNNREWDDALFDRASLEGRAPESLSLATEVMDEPRAERFIVRIYDWSWRTAFRCANDCHRYRNPPHISRDLIFAMAVLNEEKYRSDPFLSARKHTGKERGRIPEDVRDEIERVASLLALVQSHEFPQPDLARWRDAFLLEPGATNERALEGILDDPLVGWTTANVLRRPEACLTPAGQAFLRGVAACPVPTIQWRVAHVLGVYPSDDNDEFLRTAAVAQRGKEWRWVRYGAIRSLMEGAYRDETRRQRTLGWVLDHMDMICQDDSLRAGLHTAIFLAEVDRSWYESVRPLVAKAQERISALGLPVNVRDEWLRAGTQLDDWLRQLSPPA